MTTNRGIISMEQCLYESIGRPSFDELHTALMLPDEYEIETVTAYPHRLELTVFNAALPNWQSEKMVQLKPMYTCTFTPDGERRETKFDHMEVIV